MAKKVFDPNKQQKKQPNQSKGFNGSKKTAGSKQAQNGSFGDKIRGYWQRLFK